MGEAPRYFYTIGLVLAIGFGFPEWGMASCRMGKASRVIGLHLKAPHAMELSSPWSFKAPHVAELILDMELQRLKPNMEGG